jgi:hypothetical protein
MYVSVSLKERMIVVRELNGVLRKATSDERLRMNETYFPKPGRKIRIPHMFEKEHLQVSLGMWSVGKDTLFGIVKWFDYSN